MEFTPRTQEVYELILQGLKGREISERMFISEKGVKFHKTIIYKKLGVKGERELRELAKSEPSKEITHLNDELPVGTEPEASV